MVVGGRRRRWRPVAGGGGGGGGRWPEVMVAAEGHFCHLEGMVKSITFGKEW